MLLHNVPELLSRTSLCPGMHCDTEAAARGGHSQNPEKMSGAQRLGLVTHVPCCRVPPQPVNAHTLSNVFLSFLCGWHGFGWCRSWRRHCCFARSKRPLCVRSHKRATTAVSTRVVTPCHSPRNLFQYAVAVAQKLCVCVCVWVQCVSVGLCHRRPVLDSHWERCRWERSVAVTPALMRYWVRV